MFNGDPSDPLDVIERLRSQVAALSDLQSKAIKHAIYVGMNPDQANEYDRRRQEITRLMIEIATIQEAAETSR